MFLEIRLDVAYTVYRPIKARIMKYASWRSRNLEDLTIFLNETVYKNDNGEGGVF